MAAGRTAVSVAHRLSTVRHCNRIVVLDQGVVVESGPHLQALTHPTLRTQNPEPSDLSLGTGPRLLARWRGHRIPPMAAARADRKHCAPRLLQ